MAKPTTEELQTELQEVVNKYDQAQAVVKIVKASRIFHMIKEQIARATALMSVVVLLLIVALSPLYVTMGLMTRQLQEKIN